jgi:hypothetical protein
LAAEAAAAVVGVGGQPGGHWGTGRALGSGGQQQQEHEQLPYQLQGEPSSGSLGSSASAEACAAAGAAGDGQLARQHGSRGLVCVNALFMDSEYLNSSPEGSQAIRAVPLNQAAAARAPRQPSGREGPVGWGAPGLARELSEEFKSLKQLLLQQQGTAAEQQQQQRQQEAHVAPAGAAALLSGLKVRPRPPPLGAWGRLRCAPPLSVIGAPCMPVLGYEPWAVGLGQLRRSGPAASWLDVQMAPRSGLPSAQAAVLHIGGCEARGAPRCSALCCPAALPLHGGGPCSCERCLTPAARAGAGAPEPGGGPGPVWRARHPAAAGSAGSAAAGGVACCGQRRAGGGGGGRGLQQQGRLAPRRSSSAPERFGGQPLQGAPAAEGGGLASLDCVC